MPAPSRLHWPSLVTVISVAILVGTELFGAAWASGWALAGYFGLGATVAAIFQGVFSVLALIAVVAVLRQALKVEPVVSRD